MARADCSFPVDLEGPLCVRIRDARMAANMSAKHLGLLLGCSAIQLIKYEKGVNRLPATMLRRLEEVFERRI